MFQVKKIEAHCDPIYYLPPHTHTLGSKETKSSTLECKENDQILKISHHKNVNKRKNRLKPVKLESKNQDQKSILSISLIIDGTWLILNVME